MGAAPKEEIRRCIRAQKEDTKNSPRFEISIHSSSPDLHFAKVEPRQCFGCIYILDPLRNIFYTQTTKNVIKLIEKHIFFHIYPKTRKVAIST